MVGTFRESIGQNEEHQPGSEGGYERGERRYHIEIETVGQHKMAHREANKA